MVVITGASDGLGEALARALAGQYDLALIARNEDKLKHVAKEVGAKPFVCDVQDPEQVKQVFEAIHNDGNHIDILINNAGTIVNGDITETDDTKIKNVMQTNALGVIYCTKYALKAMKQLKSGLIINVVSQSGLNARAQRSVYNASKWAVNGFTKAIQQEAAEYNVRVTGFYPGTINTKLFEKAGIELTGVSIAVDDAVRAIMYVINQPDDILIPEIGIKHRNG